MTNYADEPRFVTEDVDLIYMGAMTENQQKMVIDKLMPHKERVRELVDKGVVFILSLIHI